LTPREASTDEESEGLLSAYEDEMIQGDMVSASNTDRLVVIVKVTVGKKEFGYLMTLPSGYVQIIPVDFSNVNVPTAGFLFFYHPLQTPHRFRESKTVMAALESVPYGGYLSRAHMGDRVTMRHSLSFHESIDVTTSYWRSFKTAWFSPAHFCVKEASNTLRTFTSDRHTRLSFHLLKMGTDFGIAGQNTCVCPKGKFVISVNPELATVLAEPQVTGRRGSSSRSSMAQVEMASIIPHLASWNLISDYLLRKKLKGKSLPTLLKPTEEGLSLIFPVALDAGHTQDEAEISSIRVLKRFNSRKQPHLLDIETKGGLQKKFIFKENDDVGMDVVIMVLLRLANRLWTEAGANAEVQTYSVIAASHRTGFIEVIAGKTMLEWSSKTIVQSLGYDEDKWIAFRRSCMGLMVLTAALGITDRHHGNILFCGNTGQVSLIDMSASLGYAAPMDEKLSINPIYAPRRLQEVLLKPDKSMCDQPTYCPMQMEQDMVNAYYELLKCPEIAVICAGYGWKIPSVRQFLVWSDDRLRNSQMKEKLRNNIVQSMDESRTITTVVAMMASAVGSK